MKAQLEEFEGCYGITLEAENLAEAAKIARMARQRTKEIRSMNFGASTAGEFTAWIVIARQKDLAANIGKP